MGQIFVIEQQGVVRLLEGNSWREPVFLNISGSAPISSQERGLLGIAFHPNYAQNRYFYLHYTGYEGDNIVSRFQANDDFLTADNNSEEFILKFPQPGLFHNGGTLAFGPDGMLYVAIGEGDGPIDKLKQDLGKTWLGTILRIDVNAQFPYGIPGSNPFYGTDFRWEIWAWGLRNPWKFSFDRQTGDLWIADVGEQLFEEVNFNGKRSGVNYGWPYMEGASCHPYHGVGCDISEYTSPAGGYGREGGCGIIGGYVYRGNAIPSLKGIYLFSDYCSGRLWGLTHTNGAWLQGELNGAGFGVSSFGEDTDGELYIADYNGGRVVKIVP
jgi:glucose/arabinose dehydrogenase